MVIAARYENGVFKPLGEVELEEGTVVEIHVPHEEGTGERQCIARLGFAGMWKDRTDIADGVSYVNALRENPRGGE